MHVAAKRAAALAEEGGGGPGSPVPVAEWLPLYGTDPYYPSRRIRRITERAYFKVMQSIHSGMVQPWFELVPSSRVMLLWVLGSMFIFSPLFVTWWYSAMRGHL